LQGTVWITDFGLAKAEGTDALTRTGDIVGTIRYMAPERFDGASSPQSDIYGLGVTLYEMLALRPAFDDSRRERLIKRIMHEEPPPLGNLDSGIARDLETIVHKAIARSPDDRFASAAEMAEDLRRFLADRPIRARRSAAWERFGRWCRRNPLVATLTAAVAALLLSTVAALSISTVLLGREQRATLMQKQQAEHNLALAKKAVDEFLNQVTENPRLNQTDLNDLRKLLLESALPFYEEFLHQRAIDAEPEEEWGRALYRLAKVRAILGENDQALAAYQQMGDIFAALVQNHPDSGAYRRDLARSHAGRGQLLATLRGQVQPAAAAQEFRRALDLQERLTADFPVVPEYAQERAASHFHLGSLLLTHNRATEAEQELRQALGLQQRLVAQYPATAEYRWQLAATHTQLGAAHRAVGRPQEAIQEAQAALSLLEHLAPDYSRWPQYRVEQARCHAVLSDVLRTLKRNPEAVQEAQQATALYESLARDFPSVVEYRFGQAQNCTLVGYAQKDAGDLAAALKSIRRGLAIFEDLAAAHPEVSDYRKKVVDIRLNAACVLVLQGQYRLAAAEVSQIDGPVVPYNMACFWSLAYEAAGRDGGLAAAERQRLGEDYAARALHWLAKARASGYFKPQGNIQWLRKDPDMQPLGGRADFQQFLADLEIP
jgi:tetratricopeptide (TPR) repeat protein